MDLYIDPGTGSMLFAILIGIIGALNFVVRNAIAKLNFLLHGGKDAKANESNIEYVIFSDDKRYWNVFEPICKEMHKRGVEVTYYTASKDDPVFDSDISSLTPVFAGEGNKAFAKLNLLRATMVISTTPGLDVYQWKRSKDVKCYVHVLHAAGEVVLYRMFGLDYYDAVLLGGQFQKDDIRALEQMRNLPPKDIAITGIPYMDVMVQRLKSAGPVEAHPRTVLLAPSWGTSAIFAKFGGKIIDALLDTGYHIIVRPHPQSFKSETDMIEKIMKDYPESDQLEWNRDVDNFDCLRRADILISDFSGVIFDFALVYDKPIIYTDTKFDVSPYDAWWLDKEIWTMDALPRIGMNLKPEYMDDLKDMIDQCLEDPKFAAGRDEVRAEVWQCYGEGAEKTVDYLIAKHDEVAALASDEEPKEQEKANKKGLFGKHKHKKDESIQVPVIAEEEM